MFNILWSTHQIIGLKQYPLTSISPEIPESRTTISNACFEPQSYLRRMGLGPPFRSYSVWSLYFLYYVGSSLHMMILICYVHILAIQDREAKFNLSIAQGKPVEMRSDMSTAVKGHFTAIPDITVYGWQN